MRIVIGIGLWLFGVVACASPAGLWTTIDDKTGEKRANVMLKIEHEELSGTIVKRFLRSDDPERCVNCPAPFTDAPIQGMRFMWGLKEVTPGEWEGGHLIDPRTGNVYRVKLTERDGQLYVRGYLGVSLFGRTQIWKAAEQ